LWLFDPVFPAAASLAIYLSGSLIGYLRTEAERKQVRGAFSQYLSPDLVERLARDPSLLRLGGETRNLTLMFCDVRGFTSISERFKADPQRLTQLINRLLTPMTEVVLERRGTIDKYMGDCIMAFWNAPLDNPAHAVDACASALAIQSCLADLNAELAREALAAGEKHQDLAVAIGINTGDCVVGNMGSRQRFDYSALGDTVNLASRLEGQSRAYGVDIVVGSSTRSAAGGLAAIELDLIVVKGKSEPERIHALLGGEDEARTPAFRDFAALHDRMLAAYRGQAWDEAVEISARCAAARPTLSALYAMYEKRIAQYRAEPPGSDWDGVFVARSK
jgi:adenylate cyclase